jgi:hypothetical protein
VPLIDRDFCHVTIFPRLHDGLILSRSVMTYTMM